MHRLTTILLFLSLIAGQAFAQVRMLSTVATPCTASSGPIVNVTDSPAPVWSELVQVAGVSSFRLEFGRVELGDPRDAVVIHNPLDGETQRLDQVGLRNWNHRSAWFNGSSVIVGLELVPGSAGSVEVAWGVGIGPQPGIDDLCGSDNRVASSDNRVFRLLLTDPAGTGVCTGFLVTPGAIFLTAGHCLSNANLTSATAEFNVPTSSVIGTLQHPPVADQFPMDMTSKQFQDAGIGQDWGVARLHPNVNGENAALENGFFGLFATTWLGTISSDARVTGYGADTSSPLMFAHHTQQSAIGNHPGLNFDLTTSLAHRVDTDGGSSGSPIIQEDGGRVAGIHTHGTCAAQGANQGTGIQNVLLQAAIAAAGGCAGLNLNNGPIFVSCSPAAWFGSPPAGIWSVAGVSGTDNWFISREAVASNGSGSACEFLLADGNLGTVPPASGLVRRISGSGTARADFQEARVMSLDQSATVPWSSTNVLKAFEFDVAAPTSVNISVSGDSSLRWHLYAPLTAFGPNWRARGQGLIASGQVGGPPVQGIAIAAPGTPCLVVFRDGGPASPSTPSISVSVCTSAGSPTVLAPGVPATLTASAAALCAPFTMTPGTGNFNAVGLASAGDTTLGLAQGVSATSGNATEFVLTFQNASAAIALTGSASAAAGAPPAVVEHVVGQPVGVGALASSIVPAGHVLALLSMATNFTGNHDLLVTGDPSLRWYLFNLGTTDVWRGRSAAIASGQVGGPGVVLNLSPINYALVVAPEGGVAPANMAFSARLAPTTTHLTLTGPGSTATVSNPGYQFTCTPPANQWTAVGILGSATNGYTISIGPAVSGTGSGSVAYAVANGRLGTVTPTDGLVSRSGTLTHANSGTLHQSTASAMAAGAPGSVTWTSTKLLHIFEFTVPAANYDVLVTGPSGLSWALFEPGTGPTWRPRNQNIAATGIGTARNGLFLAPGSYAVVVHKSFAGSPSGTVTCSVTASTNPVPAITAVTPSALPAGSPPGSILLDGTGFTALTTATIDGAVPLAVVSQTATQVVVGIPASILQAAGTHSITLSNPAPGGGTSAPAAFAVLAPKITAASPASIAPIPPGGLPVTITVDGVAFLPGAEVHAGEAILPTTFVSATQLTALVGPSVPDAVFAGGMALTVENAHGVQSNTVSVQVAPGGNNAGSVVRRPLEPFPSEPYVARLEGGVPGSVFSLLADIAYPNPTLHWPDTTGDMVLRITSGAVIPLLDGFGLYSQANNAAVFGFDPNGTAPGGVFDVPGFIWPATPFNARLALQSVHLDPAAAYGFTLSWPRTEDI